MVIGEAARRRALLVFDFDGTLAPIVDDPSAAVMSEHTRALLRAVAMAFPSAVVSGRARADVVARVARIPLRAVVGNHGAEPLTDEPSPVVRARVLAWAAALRDVLREEGVEVEDKRFSVAVHVRRAAAPDEARERILRLTSALPGARVFAGKGVVNVVPADAHNKANALEALAARLPGSPVLYVGDDDTDEDAFRSPALTWGIRVGRSKSTAARYYVDDRPEVDALLRALLFGQAAPFNRDPQRP